MRKLWEKLWMWWRVWQTKASLPALARDERKDATDAFREFCLMWVQGWNEVHEVEKLMDVNVKDELGNPTYDENGRPIFEKKLQKVIEAVPQPPRIDEMIKMGQGRIARTLLIMAYERGSLQGLVSDALRRNEDKLPNSLREKSWEEIVDVIAANMVQVCHVAFPDLQGTYDYTQGWKRRL